MNRQLSAVRIARRNGQAIREFIATANPFALDSVLGPPEASPQPATLDTLYRACDECRTRQQKRYPFPWNAGYYPLDKSKK